MQRFALVLLGVGLLLPQAAQAGQEMGSGALALAAIVGELSPDLDKQKQQSLADLFAGQKSFSSPAGERIDVAADSIQCRASNVDITEHSCDLTFHGKVVSLAGRPAHELFATLLEAGIEPDVGAGNIGIAITKLRCGINVDGAKSADGSGANCSFDANSN
jgi:hypothetical protein